MIVRFLLLAALGAALGLTAIQEARAQPTLRPTEDAADCLVDSQIPPAQRAAVENAGLSFVQAMLGADTGTAYAKFTPETRGSLAAADFAGLAEQARESLDAVRSLQVAHTYFVKGIGRGHDKKITCGSMGRPDDFIRVAVKPATAQAHLLIEGRSASNAWSFVLWLIEGQGWQVQNVFLGMTRMIDKSPADFLRLALDQVSRKHDFNAALLYATADNLADYGPDFELGVRAAIRREAARLKLPRALQGETAPSWRLGKKTYRILAVGPVGAGGKLYLMINWETSAWGSDKEVETRNQDFIAAFAQAYPEYADAFAGLIVSAVEKGGGRGYRSIHAAAKVD